MILVADGMGADEDQLQIPALGRSGHLGFLYDARTETFQGSIFKEAIDEKLVQEFQKPYTYSNTSWTNSLDDKFSLFDVRAELRASILFGLLTVSGSAAYLTEEKKTARQLEGALILKTETLTQQLPLYYDSLRPFYHRELLSHTPATHVVTGIKWGANVTISFSEKFQESRSKEEVKGSMAIAMDKLKGIFSVSGSAQIESRGHDVTENSGFSFKIYGDIQLPAEFPQSFQEIKDLIKKIPESIAKHNEGKGVQLEFTLTPVSHLREHLKLDDKLNHLFLKLDDSLNQEIIQRFDDLSEMEQRLSDLLSDFTSYSFCTLPEFRSQLVYLKRAFSNSKVQLKSSISQALVQVRSGKMDPSQLTQFLTDYDSPANECNLRNVERKLEMFEPAISKINFCKMLRKSYPKVTYVGQDASLEQALFDKETAGKVVYVLNMNAGVTGKDVQCWRENLNCFLSTLYQPFNRLLLVDTELNIPAHKNSIARTCIHQIYDGRIIRDDVLAEIQSKKAKKPLELKAIGRMAKLGDFYDERSGRFLEGSILLAGYPSALVLDDRNELRDNSEIEIVRAGSFEERCKVLGIEPPLQRSILAKEFALKKSGAYLEEPSEGEIGVVHSRRLDEEAINLKSCEFPKHLDIDTLMASGATHFVQKVQYGFNSIFSFLSQKARAGDGASGQASQAETIERQASKLKKILTQADFTTMFSKADNEKDDSKSPPAVLVKATDLQELGSDIMVKIFTDLQAHPERVGSPEELLQYFNLKYLLQQATQIQGGKGQPIAFLLYPLDNLRNSFGVITPPDPLSQDTLSMALQPGPSGIYGLYENLRTRVLALEELIATRLGIGSE